MTFDEFKHVLWTGDNLAASSLSDEIKKRYPNFTFNAQLQQDPEIQMFLMRLMITSFVKNDKINKDKRFAQKLPIYMRYVENFILAGIRTGIITTENKHIVLERLNENFKCIEFLPLNFRGVYGCSVDDTIQINPDMGKHGNSPSLTADEVTMMYMFHEIGHKILKVADLNRISLYCQSYSQMLAEKGKINNVVPVPTNLIYQGFLMMEEALTQEMAESLTYYISDKPRPKLRWNSDLGVRHISNFDYYGIFESPTVDMGRTMRGCLNRDSKLILKGMIKRGLNGSFVDSLVSEYNAGDAELFENLFTSLCHMGNIQARKYRQFGQNSNVLITNCDVARSISVIKKLANKNEDSRAYPIGGFPPISYDSYLGGFGAPGRR